MRPADHCAAAGEAAPATLLEQPVDGYSTDLSELRRTRTQFPASPAKREETKRHRPSTSSGSTSKMITAEEYEALPLSIQ